MGQYFKLVNTDAQEYVELPGTMKAIERVTNGVAMGMIGYLLLEGPQDGTSFCYRGEVNPEEVDEYIRERSEEQGGSEWLEVYQNDDGSINYEKLQGLVDAGKTIAEANDYAGRWAGDSIRLVGDYADNDLYNAAKPITVVEYEGEEYEVRGAYDAVEPYSDDHPYECAHTGESASPGDTVSVQLPVGTDGMRERVYATVVEIRETDWTNITDGLTEEYVNFVGENWLEANTTERTFEKLTA